MTHSKDNIVETYQLKNDGEYPVDTEEIDFSSKSDLRSEVERRVRNMVREDDTQDLDDHLRTRTLLDDYEPGPTWIKSGILKELAALDKNSV